MNLPEQLKHMADQCNACDLCVRECAFLQRYGNPKQIAEAYDSEDRGHQILPFECHLCGLCQAVCPKDLDPARMFLSMRKNSIGKLRKKRRFKRILAYEKRGTSRRYSYYALPEGCETVFFPGCALPGTRPEVTLKLIQHLQHRIPSLGIVLDCCTMPSHDLGYFDHFRQMFYEMTRYLSRNHVQHILTACPNCFQIFKKYGHGLSVQMVHEVLNQHPPEDLPSLPGTLVLHDPCPMRFEDSAMQAVRDLMAKTGLSLTPMAHEKDRSVCCGEGGAVFLVSKPLSENWKKIRKDEAGGSPVLTYCAGCTNNLGKTMATFHILDLLFDPPSFMNKKPKVSRAPFTYWNRLSLKKRLRKTFLAKTTRERSFLDGILSYNNLLIVDPDPSFTVPLAEQLEKMGFSVFLASSGEEALKRVYKNDPVDVVLLDTVLPDRTGMEVLGRIKAHKPFIQGLVMTGKSSVPEAISSMKSGASEYLVKPLGFETLLTHIQAAMDEKQDYEQQMLAVQTGPFTTPRHLKTRMAEIKAAAAKQRGA
ncbi:MAG: response regulator [Proteobacteria bacterium]|nr:response regulator [Pseudomonadota bacterium]MBU4471659.1 response regulator [Pseudomonadota bacterium]MCG2751140.1 response regulator [Desulfobacteraceae bacterium]